MFYGRRFSLVPAPCHCLLSCNQQYLDYISITPSCTFSYISKVHSFAFIWHFISRYVFNYGTDIIPNGAQLGAHPENIWLASLLPHARQQCCSVALCLLFILGVMKKRVRFFHPNSLHIHEFVLVCGVSHISSHSSGVMPMPSSLSHLALM